MKIIAVLSEKGGVAKTTLSHALAYGASWYQTPAHLAHTDDKPFLENYKETYKYYDARNPEVLAKLVNSVIETGANKPGILIIDGGGNRSGFDKWVSSVADLIIAPLTVDNESVNKAKLVKERFQETAEKPIDVRYIVTRWPSRKPSQAKAAKKLKNWSLDIKEVLHFMQEQPDMDLLNSNFKDINEPGKIPTAVNNISRDLFISVNNALYPNNDKSLL